MPRRHQVVLTTTTRQGDCLLFPHALPLSYLFLQLRRLSGRWQSWGLVDAMNCAARSRFGDSPTVMVLESTHAHPKFLHDARGHYESSVMTLRVLSVQKMPHHGSACVKFNLPRLFFLCRRFCSIVSSSRVKHRGNAGEDVDTTGFSCSIDFQRRS